MKIPVVLPLVTITINADGLATVAVDHQPYACDRQLTRTDVAGLLDEITSDLATPVRIEITESDGTTYTDIATPPQTPAREVALNVVPAPQDGRSRGRFRPGEQVAVAYIILRQPADATGNAHLRLPPALIQRGLPLILVGLESQAITILKAPEHEAPEHEAAERVAAEPDVEDVA